MKSIRKVLILSHRYLGIALSLMVAVWFASGIVMMYAGGMPRLTPAERLSRLDALDVARVRLTPADAVESAGASFARVTLLTVNGRPAYRVGPVATIFADTGERLDSVTADEARHIAGRFLGAPDERVSHVGTLTAADQWTLGQGRLAPLHKFAADDEAGTELYVSGRTGEVTMLTTRRSRLLAWMGTIPHWLYFSALRANQPLWYRIVVWASTLACVLAVLGLILAVTQFRRTKPFRLSGAIPYSGWMRWHYITGAVFGLFTLTWAFSGLLSMEPYAWTNATGLEVDRDVFTGGPIDYTRFPPMEAAAWDRVVNGRGIKEIELARIQDEHYYIVRSDPAATGSARRERLHQPYQVAGQSEPDRLLVKADTLEIRREPFSVDSLVGRLRAEYPDVPIVEQQLLADYDSYYYSRARLTPLPVLRVKFADPAESWLYIDPETSQVLAEIHRLARVERWLYNGLHSLDFPFWYSSIAWDVGMILLCLGGLASSGIGVLLGIRRMRRATVRAVGSLDETVRVPQSAYK
jgi:PepSY-associated transmembrane protein